MRDCRGFSMSDWVKTIYVVRAKRSEIFSGNVSSQYAHRTLMDRGYSKCVELNCFLQHFRNCFEVRNFSKTVCCILDVRSRPETKAFLSFLILESNIQINLSMFVYLSIYSFSYSVASSCSPPFFKGLTVKDFNERKEWQNADGDIFPATDFASPY